MILLGMKRLISAFFQPEPVIVNFELVFFMDDCTHLVIHTSTQPASSLDLVFAQHLTDSITTTTVFQFHQEVVYVISQYGTMNRVSKSSVDSKREALIEELTELLDKFELNDQVQQWYQDNNPGRSVSVRTSKAVEYRSICAGACVMPNFLILAVDIVGNTVS